MADTVDDYWARLPAEDLAEAVLNRTDDIIQLLRSARIYDRYSVNYKLYYGLGPGANWSDNLRPDGDDGESVGLCINIARQLLQKQLAMIVGVRPPVTPKALSTDEGAARKVQIGRGLIEKVFRKLDGYKVVDDATEQGQAIGAGFVHGTWDHFAGGLHATSDDPEEPGKLGLRARHKVVLGDDGQPMPKAGPDGQPVLDEAGQPVPQTISEVFQGEVMLETLTVKDVYFDPSATSWKDIDWIAVRTWRNRWDIAALYPERYDAILDAQSRSEMQMDEWDAALPSPMRGGLGTSFQDDKILVWHFYHRRSAAVPDGILALFLDDEAVLEHGNLPFKTIPVWRLAPSSVIGTAFPYGSMNSLGGIQEAFNNLWSSVITNVMAFSRSLLWTHKGSGVEYSQIGGGLKLLELDAAPDGGDPVKVLDLMKLPEELFKVSEMLQSFGQSDTGMNAIAMGDPRGVTAGISINLFESMAQQFSSPLEAARTDALEAIALWTLEAYRQHPDMERDLHVTGADRQSALTRFYGKDLDGLDDVDVEAGNPMDRTVAGRLQKVQALHQLGAPITIEQAMQVMDTGNIDAVTDGVADEMALIEAENEAMSKGQPVPARMGDNHVLHVQGHRKVGSNPEVRIQDAQMRAQYAQQLQASGLPPGHPSAPPMPAFPLGAFNEHEMQHLQLWSAGDPILNMVQGRLPPGPPPPPGASLGPPGAPPALPHPPGAPVHMPGAPPPPTPLHATQGPPPKKPPDPEAAFRPPPVAPLPPIGAQRAPAVQ